MTKRPMGMYTDMPFEDYHAVQAMSASAMKHLERSPWHFKNRVEIVPTKAMLNGTLVHCAALEPDAMAERYVVVPPDSPNRPSVRQWAAKKPSPESIAAMEWWTKFQESCGTRAIVSADDYALTKTQLAALYAEREIGQVLRNGLGEVSLFWVDKATGVYCKARLDCLEDNGREVRVLDLKATVDDSPRGFRSSMARMGYHRQRAHYMNGFKAVTGRAVDDFFFAVVSSAPPVLASAYRLVDEAAQQGFDEVAELLALYAKCEREGNWPAYLPSERMIDLPAWAKASGEVEVGYAE